MESGDGLVNILRSECWASPDVEADAIPARLPGERSDCGPGECKRGRRRLAGRVKATVGSAWAFRDKRMNVNTLFLGFAVASTGMPDSSPKSVPLTRRHALAEGMPPALGPKGTRPTVA